MENSGPKILSLKSAPSPEQALRQRLGVAGLDERIGGGIRKGSSLLILGAPGGGKTTFGIQFLLEGMKQGERGIYFHIGKASPLLVQGLPFHEQLSVYERKFQFQVVSQELEESFGTALQDFFKGLKGLEQSRVVIDVAVGIEHLRPAQIEFCARILERFQEGGATCVILNRCLPPSLEELGPAQLLAPAADAIFVLRLIEKGQELRRSLVIYSVLGVAHAPSVLELDLDVDGLRLQNGEVGLPSQSRHMLVASPIFRDSQEKLLYQKYFKRLFRSSKSGERLNPSLHRKQMLFYDILTELHSSSTPFGLLLVYDAILPFLARQGLIQPLDQVFPDYERRFLGASVRRCVVDGRLFAAPLHSSLRILFWRRDLLEKHRLRPPKNWKELEATALKVVELEKKPKLRGLALYFPPYVQFSNLLEQLWNQGQDLYQNPSHWDFNRNSVVEVLERLRRWVQHPQMAGGASLQSSYWDAVQEFIDGKAVFLHHWSDALRLIMESGKEMQEKVGWTVLSSASSEKGAKALLGGPVYVIPARTQFKEGAEEALQRLFRGEAFAAYDAKLGWPFPSLREIYRDAEAIKRHPYYSQAEKVLESGRYIEEAPYIKGNFLNWENTASQILGPYFAAPEGGAAKAEEAADALKQRLGVFLPKPVYSDLVAKAVEYIHQNLGHPLNIAQLADEIGVSRSHLIRQFKKATRMTPLRYLNIARVEKGKELLQYTTFNVSEVSLQVGFKSIFHFSKVFRQLSGRNPSDFKQFRYQPK